MSMAPDLPSFDPSVISEFEPKLPSAKLVVGRFRVSTVLNTVPRPLATWAAGLGATPSAERHKPCLTRLEEGWIAWLPKHLNSQAFRIVVKLPRERLE